MRYFAAFTVSLTASDWIKSMEVIKFVILWTMLTRAISAFFVSM